MRTECEIRSTSTHTAVACDQPAGIYVLILSTLKNLGHFQPILDKENSKIFRGSMPPHPLENTRALGPNGENVLISDFQMLAIWCSQRIMWLEVVHSNNDPYIVAQHYLDKLEVGAPRLVKADCSKENVNITAIQRFFHS